MRRQAVLIPGVVILLVAALAAIKSEPERVEIDAVVLDDHGGIVAGLQQGDFHVREGGRPVTVDSFSEVSSLGIGGGAGSRSIILLLDDSTVPPQATSIVQDIARLVVAQANAADKISVIRLNRRSDEVVWNQPIALSRIAEYRAGMTPFAGIETLQSALSQVTKLSREFERVEHQRKVIVGIGSREVFDIPEPRDRENSLLWTAWTAAVAGAARANVSVYVIDPAGLTGRVQISRSTGLVAETGGAAFYNSHDFQKAVDDIWREASHYYLLGYAPVRSSAGLQAIDVAVGRPKVHVRARRMRG